MTADDCAAMPCFTLWATDELRLVTDKSPDSLSLALTCRSLRDAVWDQYFCERRDDHRACALKWPFSDYFAAPFEAKGPKLRSGLRMYVVSPSRLSWALSAGCPLGSDVCAASARGGHMDTLCWAVEQGCPLEPSVYLRAVEGGHDHIVYWAHQQGLGWAETPLWAGRDVHVTAKKVCAAAAAAGNRDLLEWLRERSCPWDVETLIAAIRAQDMGLLEWLSEKGCPVTPHDGPKLAGAAAGVGNLPMLKWLVNAHGWDCVDTCPEAAKGGHLEVVQWLRSQRARHGCDCYDGSVDYAKEHGHAALLKWLTEECDHSRDYPY